MAPPPAVPSRVHILLASNAPYAVAIRRGPAKRVCTVGWNREKDTFAVGQWLKGRIYERRSDLSPDGKYLIYFALNGRWQSEAAGAWTAISFAPYLKAIGLWANGSAWNGGGLFVSKTEYWLNKFTFGHGALRVPAKLTEVPFPFHESYGGECPGVYYVRLQRQGWRFVHYEKKANPGAYTLFEKSIGKGWLLEKTAHESQKRGLGHGSYFDTHRLKRENGSEVIDKPGWEWADLDGRRIVWVEKGILYAADLSHEGLGSGKILYDFNKLTYEEIKAPY